MSIDISIVFDNPLATYFAGETVTGHVVLKLSKEKKFQALQLRFLGEANVFWTETTVTYCCGRVQTITIVYSNNEKYIENYVFLVGGPAGEVVLPAGEYSYPFVLLMPTNIPSSFEGGIGYTRYSVKAKMIRPWKFDSECFTPFTVLNIFDLNSDASLLERVQKDTQKYVCCCCCRSGPITTVVTLPFTGFVSGQSCHALVEFDNLSKSLVIGKVALYQMVTFFGQNGLNNKEKKIKSKITEEVLGEVKGRESKTFTANLCIPSVPVSSLQFCGIIDISYFLQFTCKVPGMHFNDTIDIPIVIGNIPLRNQFDSLIEGETGQDRVLAVPEIIRDSYPNIVPPSYEECMGINSDNTEGGDNGNQQKGVKFTPRYPTYHFK